MKKLNSLLRTINTSFGNWYKKSGHLLHEDDMENQIHDIIYSVMPTNDEAEILLIVLENPQLLSRIPNDRYDEIQFDAKEIVILNIYEILKKKVLSSQMR